MSSRIPRLPREYSVRFADEGHQPLDTWERYCARVGYATLGLYLSGVLVGTGEIEGRGRIHRRVNTHSMSLRPQFRKQGHGIWLYLAVIQAAKKLGVEIISSSWCLNQFSRRMWSVKLAKFYKIHRVGGCYNCGRKGRYYIRFKESK